MDELYPFMLDVEGIEEAAEREEKRAGSGSFGYVFKVTVGGAECIAKKLHSAFVSKSVVSSLERRRFLSKFRNECIILSKLRHPNIVQFVGVHCGSRGSADLTLIMECVRSDMNRFMSENPKVPLSVKLCILLDVSYGLVYLHEFNPPIVHRDLTARNILITGKCQAKIADLGVAKIVTPQQQRDEVHTQTPGQMYFMPPEAQKERAECTPKLDVFSFGHLGLFVALQGHPKVDYIISQTAAMQEGGTVEREKRKKSLDQVGSDHCLYPIITECLYDRPDQRPTTRDLNQHLINLAAQKSVLLNNILPLMEGTTATAASEELDDLKTKVNELEKEKSQARVSKFVQARSP